MINPVPVTLKRFFALEFVLTFGILITCNSYSLLAPRTDGNFLGRVGNVEKELNLFRAAKVRQNIRKTTLGSDYS